MTTLTVRLALEGDPHLERLRVPGSKSSGEPAVFF
jgi:hypothetical protein